jgi:predicted transcriptional regulator
MRKFITPSCRKILAFFALEEGAKNKYEIAKKTGLSHSRVHESVRMLKNFGLVKGEETGKARTGLPIVSYSLTLKGLLEALVPQEELWELTKIKKIATNHQQLLPLVFGEWGYFSQAKVEQILANHLRWAMENEYREYPLGKWSPTTEEEPIMDRITFDTLFPYPIYIIHESKEQVNVWLNALANNSRIGRWVTKKIEEREKGYSFTLKFFNAARKSIQQKNTEFFFKFLTKTKKGGEKS